MPKGRFPFILPVRAALFGILLYPLAFSGSAAQADVYHAVAPGETLASVATRYHVSVQDLRNANNLTGTGENDALGAMLLRVPGVDDGGAAARSLANMNVPAAATTSAPAPAASESSATAPAQNSGFGDNNLGNNTLGGDASSEEATGLIARSVPETVRPGDTWESIAARYRAAGHDVTVDSLKARNNYEELPNPGEVVLVPLGQVTYSYTPATIAGPAAAPVQTAPAAPANVPADDASAPAALGGGVVASGDMELPFAKNVPSVAPVYEAPNGPAARGSLSSRGGYGELSRGALGDSTQILGDGQEATAPPAPMYRTATSTPSLAHVAQVAVNGAHIRRLPQASAVTLYNCAVGTQLAVLQENAGWSAILMSDRSTGWVPSHYLTMTNETIDISHVVLNTSGPGGEVTGYNRNYASECPMVAQALTWLGTPYRYGGTSRYGIDCSSLVQHAFAACGLRLPRTAAQQALVGYAVDPANLRAGDRLYFSASGTRIDHTGLYMGDGLFVQASGSGHQVMVSNLFEPRNWNIFVGARR